MRPDRDITDPRIAKALAHPLRVRILAILGERTASPRELSLELDADLSLVSYHVRTLHRMGLLDLVTRKRRRAAVETYYRASERPVVTSTAWGKMPRIVKNEVVAGTIGQLAEHVNAAVAADGFEREQAHISRSPMVLDEKGFEQVAAKLDSLLKDLERIGAAAEKRLATRDHEGAITATAALMLFETDSASRHGGADGSHGTHGAESAPRARRRNASRS